MSEQQESPYESNDDFILTINELMDNLNAEDDEKQYIEHSLLPQAQAYVNNFLNVTDDLLTDDEKMTKKRIVLFVATDWYYNRSGEGNLNKKSYTGINTLIDSIRNMGIGYPEYEKH